MGLCNICFYFGKDSQLRVFLESLKTAGFGLLKNPRIAETLGEGIVAFLVECGKVVSCQRRL